MPYFKTKSYTIDLAGIVLAILSIIAYKYGAVSPWVIGLVWCAKCEISYTHRW